MEIKLKWFTSQKGKLFFYKKTASLIASSIISLVKIFWLSFGLVFIQNTWYFMTLNEIPQVTKKPSYR